MKYRLIITPRTWNEVAQNVDWWGKHRSPDQAGRWYDRFVQITASLADDPRRWPLAREAAKFPFELRQFNFGIGARPTHRGVYKIVDDQVVILHVLHLAAADLTPEDL